MEWERVKLISEGQEGERFWGEGWEGGGGKWLMGGRRPSEGACLLGGCLGRWRAGWWWGCDVRAQPGDLGWGGK